ncbi:MAG TPA: Flp family type IVb pilin [Bryobacteraceae bacterium]|nr:Flp family type IVb pilin [Bryobacteraceae bacterium]
MQDIILKLYVKFKTLLSSEQGQDTIEYALLAAIVALGTAAGMDTIATDINTAFTTIGTKITSEI